MILPNLSNPTPYDDRGDAPEGWQWAQDRDPNSEYGDGQRLGSYYSGYDDPKAVSQLAADSGGLWTNRGSDMRLGRVLADGTIGDQQYASGGGWNVRDLAKIGATAATVGYLNGAQGASEVGTAGEGFGGLAEGGGADIGAGAAGGGGAVSGGGAAAAAPATNAALAESAVGSTGYGASSAGVGGAAKAGGSLMSQLSGALPESLGGWADLFKSGYGLYSAFNQDSENADMRQGSAEVGAAAQGLAATQATTLRDETLPMLKERDTAQWGTSRGLVDSNLEDAGLARDRATQAWDQGTKDYEFQDIYRDMARKASDGSYGDELAGISNADTAQAFDAAEGARQRNAQRLGVNPGSGAYLASMADSYNNRALAQAGGATQARRFARDKAETMVATAAKGYGNPAISATQAGLSTASRGAAGTANSNGVTNTANIQSVANNAYGAINTSLGVAGSAFNRTAAPTPAMVGAVSGAVDRFNGKEPPKP